MTHAHITTWVVALILFVVAIFFQAKGHEKTKMVHMLLRLFYVLIIATGAWILHSMSSFPFLYIVKVIVGLWVIATMEMILVRTAKGKNTNVLWLQFLVAFVVVLYLGFKLPFGFSFFS
ncbi:YisL family protein [Anoxybacillus suryakundensis]|uniref:UPF0344 protein Ga0061060_103120 n=1 Tax=Anoxybacillus suryakundensis TaxID=1325335 RepID=A0A0K6GKQ7_9BACL|nr:YisL family protein [Anoxybacillus suryakundensis]CUA79300.1 Protein of unknown function (DUF1516) [Anoxybacillus suryakundensis]